METKVYQAFRNIIKNKHEKALNYCVNYARAGLHMTGYELKVQCLYVLNNMTHWRGKDARKARNIIKEYIKEVK